MERRKVIKGIAATAGMICARPEIFAFGQDQGPKEKANFAIPIRGLTNKAGRLVQPVQLTIEHAGADATLVVSLDNRQVENRVVPQGTHTFNVYIDAVETARPMLIKYEIAGKSEAAEVSCRAGPQGANLHPASFPP